LVADFLHFAPDFLQVVVFVRPREIVLCWGKDLWIFNQI
jgi:hypothetical protein